MSKEISRTSVPIRRFAVSHNTMTFPRELREAIPDLPTCAGRVLELHSIFGEPQATLLLGPRVHLDLAVKETGKLKGEFVVWLDLEPSAARALATTLVQLADRIGKK